MGVQCSTEKGLCEVANDTHVIKELTLCLLSLIMLVQARMHFVMRLICFTS